MDGSASSTEQPVLRFDDVTRIYGTDETSVRALQNVSFTLDRSEVAALIGPSGSGKTTLLQIAGAIDRPTTGRVLYRGCDLADLKGSELTVLRRRHIGFVFQQFNLVPGLSARDNVALIARLDGVSRAPARDRASELLAQMGLANRSNHLPGRLSGGEQQRVAIARSLMNKPSLILADEPTGSLDRAAGEHVVELLMDTAVEQGASVLIVTHDASLASRVHHTLTITDGQLHQETSPTATESTVL